MPDSIVNPQITDAVTQANVKVLGESPPMAMSTLYQSMSQASAILFQNAVSAQQQQNTLSQAAANQGIMQIYNVDTTGAAKSGVPDNLASLLTVLKSYQ
ncbi:RebB family R body protein [Pseudomonas capsici]|uniref:RebB family R body protein n=2 Tax=Pseudomonas capsici TaxID=2810614 RepID=A0ABT3C452_9PSED|nr:RebB family R body protein [Pseudomonas capsici]MBN6717184.1 RebB family R body protein [Pseudomonas capsici]MBN6722248.1 RebB family R body protein [Pseudomonas capsici]MBN6727146.1 RebB family R body protein [Pseudomonas capsici]MCV4270871.1 RebB family R body protein [Pseudomonas capsici]MCV4281021.1 RebB family R body protein [Pseudomonas capsici]